MACSLLRKCSFWLNHGDPCPPSHHHPPRPSYPHLTNTALSELTDKPCGRVTSGIQEPQLTPGLQKDTQLQKTSNVKYGRTCEAKGCGLHGITIPGAAVALKGTSLPSGKLIGWTDNSVMVIFPDSQQSLLAPMSGEVDYVMSLKASWLLLQRKGLCDQESFWLVLFFSCTNESIHFYHIPFCDLDLISLNTQVIFLCSHSHKKESTVCPVFTFCSWHHMLHRV